MNLKEQHSRRSFYVRLRYLNDNRRIAGGGTTQNSILIQSGPGGLFASRHTWLLKFHDFMAVVGNISEENAAS